MLSKCRVTCRRLFAGERHLPAELEEVGGLGDEYVDQLGFRLSLCRESEGFTQTQRYNLLQLRLLGERAAPYVPKFTELGFEKARMPGELLEFLQNKIRAAPDPSSWRTETNPARGQINRH